MRSVIIKGNYSWVIRANDYVLIVCFSIFEGAFGHFEVTHDITQYTKAKVFSKIGKKTPIAVRCSTVGGESGSADTVR